MITSKSRARKLNLAWMAVGVLALVLAAPVSSQDDPFLDDPSLPEPLDMPGRVEGTGTYFEIDNSNYLNITLESSEPLHLSLASLPEMIVMHLQAAGGATVTQITLSGLLPSTSYYRDEDDYHNRVTLTADDNGGFTFSQDLSEPHVVSIQQQVAVIQAGWCHLIPGDTSIGTWDNANRIYTLTTDAHKTICIVQNSMTLDGDGHSVSGLGSAVRLESRSDVIIENLNASAYAGIYLSGSTGNTLRNNIAFGSRGPGIYLYASSDNILTGNTVANRTSGIYFLSSHSNILVGNAVSQSRCALDVASSNGNTLTSNTVSSNTYGTRIRHSSSNQFYHNNFPLRGLNPSDPCLT